MKMHITFTNKLSKMVGWSEKFLFMIFEIQHLLRLDTSWISGEESDHNVGQEQPTEKKPVGRPKAMSLGVTPNNINSRMEVRTT